MAKSSINLKLATLFAFLHNTREAIVSYVISDTSKNEYDKNGKEAYKYYLELLDKSSSNYMKRTNQSIQTNEKKFLWEAVVNLDDYHELKDLQNLASVLESIYGWQIIQLAMHRDEGHIDKKTGEKIYNNHGHMVFLMLNKDGIYTFKKRDFGIKRMQQLQTIVANVLGMERGKSKKKTKRERLEHREYRAVAQMEEKMTIKMDFISEKLNKLKKNKKKTASKIRTLSKKSNKNKNDLKKLYKICQESVHWVFDDLSTYPKLNMMQNLENNDLIYEWIKAAQCEIDTLTVENMRLRDSINYLEEELSEMESKHEGQYRLDMDDLEYDEENEMDDDEYFINEDHDDKFDDEFDDVQFGCTNNAEECYEEENEMDIDEGNNLGKTDGIKKKLGSKKLSDNTKKLDIDVDLDPVNTGKKDFKKNKHTKRKIKR